MKAFVRGMRATGPFGLAWGVEPNPLLTGNHVHGWVKARSLLVNVTDAVAAKSGMGLTHVGPIRVPRVPLTYSFKAVIHGDPDPETALQTHMRLNGNRLIHATRGFYLGPEGPIGQQEALRGLHRSGAGSEWDRVIRREWLS
jgi:hypothetical protein